MTSVFISYSRVDRAAADYIASELRNRGADVFIDYQKLRAGEDFVSRLGHEIEIRDYLLFLISPRSVKSQWVKAEVGWALYNNKLIIPVILEASPLNDFFFLIRVEQIDFGQWNIDNQVDAAIKKIAQTMGLPEEPIRTNPISDIKMPSEEMIDKNQVEDDAIEQAFSLEEISNIFLSAAEIADKDPERSYYLYQQVVNMNPDFMQGKVKEIVERESERLKPARIEKMLIDARIAADNGSWSKVSQIAQDILLLDINHKETTKLLEVARAKMEFESIYSQMVRAAEVKNWKAVSTLIPHIYEKCPEYGDAAVVLPRVPVQASLVDYLKSQVTIKTEWDILSHSFSNNGEFVYLYLGVFGSYRVEIYRVLTGEKVNTFEVGAGGRFSLSSTLFASNHMGIFSNHREILEVFSGSKMPKIKTEGWGLSFSYDDRFVASMSNDEVKLWSVQSGKLLKTIKKERDNWFKEIAFSPVGPYLFVCSYNKIMVFDLSFSNNIRKTRETAAHAQKLAISLDGSLIAAAEWKEICIFEVSSFRLTSSLTLSETIDQIDLSPNGRILVSTSGEKVSYWKIPSGNLLFTLEKRRSAPLPFAFSPDNSLVVTTSEDGSIDIRESESGRIIRNIDARANLEDVPRIIQFSNAGNILALATEDKTLSLWWLGSPKSTH